MATTHSSLIILALLAAGCGALAACASPTEPTYHQHVVSPDSAWSGTPSRTINVCPPGQSLVIISGRRGLEAVCQ